MTSPGEESYSTALIFMIIRNDDITSVVKEEERED